MQKRRRMKITTQLVSSRRPAAPPLTNVEVAARLPGVLANLVSRAKLGPPLPTSLAPRLTTAGKWKDPTSGDRLFAIPLGPTAGKTAAATMVLVNPKRNEFFAVTSRGGTTFVHGSVALPKSVQFTGARFSPAQLDLLEKAANPVYAAPGRPAMRLDGFVR